MVRGGKQGLEATQWWLHRPVPSQEQEREDEGRKAWNAGAGVRGRTCVKRTAVWRSLVSRPRPMPFPLPAMLFPPQPFRRAPAHASRRSAELPRRPSRAAPLGGLALFLCFCGPDRKCPVLLACHSDGRSSISSG